jgi:predicted deacylase
VSALSAPRYARLFEGRLGTRVPGLQAYRGHAELLTAMRSLEARGARLSVDGESHEGAPLVRLSLGPEEAPRASFVVAGLHAMEWIGVESCLALVERLLARPLRRRIDVLPLANPDGFRRAERDLVNGRRRFVRANARGVDLNRNWPTHWRPRLTWPTLLPFLGGPGERPGSEPELAALLAALHHLVPRVDRALSLHSFGRMLLLPYGGRWAAPPRWPHLLAHARAVAAGLPGYRIRQSARWVPGAFAHGMELDHFDALGVDALLVECSAGGLRLGAPGSWLHPLRWFNPPDLEAERARIADALLPFVDPPEASG